MQLLVLFGMVLIIFVLLFWYCQWLLMIARLVSVFREAGTSHSESMVRNNLIIFQIMFGNKLLLYIKKPSVYNIRKIQSTEVRKKLLQQKLMYSPSLVVQGNNKEYNEVYDVIVSERQQQIAKYEKSILWSPRYTPWHFKYLFIWPACFVALLLCYVRFIAQPKRMLDLKKKYGIKFKDLEKMGWLDSWLDQYNRKDEVLTFEAYDLKDLEILYKEGLIAGATEQQRQQQEKRAKKRKNKFISGNKEFVLGEFRQN